RWHGNGALEEQITLMNARAIEAIAERAEWALAGDQFYVDLDLSQASLPPGTQLELGSARIEISAKSHAGCKKFTARFGSDAPRWVTAPVGRELRLRGVNARVVRGGTVRRGDQIVVLRG